MEGREAGIGVSSGLIWRWPQEKCWARIRGQTFDSTASQQHVGSTCGGHPQYGLAHTCCPHKTMERNIVRAPAVHAGIVFVANNMPMQKHRGVHRVVCGDPTRGTKKGGVGIQNRATHLHHQLELAAERGDSQGGSRFRMGAATLSAVIQKEGGTICGQLVQIDQNTLHISAAKRS